MAALPDLATLRRATFLQVARLINLVGRRQARRKPTGYDASTGEEPVRFVASQRLGLPTGDVEAVEEKDGQLTVTANVLGLAGRTPALPPHYSELQLERRRARDTSLADFLNIFDHRALSFLHRIAEKYRWPLLVERRGSGEADPVGNLLLALGGIQQEQSAWRLDLPASALIPMTAHLADTRRCAASVAAILRAATGYDLVVVEALPTWIDVPQEQQTRIGVGGRGAYAQLGGGDESDEAGMGQAAMIGSSVLDVQHNYLIQIGPLPYAELRRFVAEDAMRCRISQLAVLAGGLEQRPSLRLLIAVADIPRLRLGDAERPAMLGWTTWLGQVDDGEPIAYDCVIPIDYTAVHQEKPVVAH